MAQRILRPLDYGGLFDELFDLYKKNFLVFMGIGGLVYVPLNLLMYYAMVDMFGSLTAEQMPSISSIVGLVVFVLASIPLSYASIAAITWAISKSYLDERPTILGSYKAILPRLMPFMLTVLLTALAYCLGFVACCVPGIALAILFAFVPVVFIVEGLSYVDAMRRSWDLVKGDFWRVLLVVVLSAVFVGIVQSILTTPIQLISMLGSPDPENPFGAFGPLLILQGLSQAVSQTLVMPLQTIALVLLYYDIRVRKEGFDLQMLAENLGESPVTVEPTPPSQA